MNHDINAAATADCDLVNPIGPIRTVVAMLGDQLELLGKAQAQLRHRVRDVTAPIPIDSEPALPADDGATCDLHADLLVLLARAGGLHADTANLAEAIRI